MITCERCKQQFDLNEAPGAALVLPTGEFIGKCPNPACRYDARPETGLKQVRHTDASVASFVQMMEMAGDNFCQRCFDLLLERGWRPGIIH